MKLRKSLKSTHLIVRLNAMSEEKCHVTVFVDVLTARTAVARLAGRHVRRRRHAVVTAASRARCCGNSAPDHACRPTRRRRSPAPAAPSVRRADTGTRRAPATCRASRSAASTRSTSTTGPYWPRAPANTATAPAPSAATFFSTGLLVVITYHHHHHYYYHHLVYL